MIEVREVTKRYGSTVAVDDLSFEVREGEVTGFLGPNGAGKSTTMRMMVGLDAPTSGRVTIDGHRYQDLRFPLHHVGALLEAKAIHPGRSARNHLRWLADSNGIDRRRVDHVLELVGLADVAHRRSGGFSLGMGQRLGIATALLGDPATLLLDEPVNGLDPEGIQWVRQLLRSLAAEGRSVLVSSHLMSEMALTADRLVVVGKGRLITEGTVDDVVGRRLNRSRASCYRRPAGPPPTSARQWRRRRDPRRRHLDRDGDGRPRGRHHRRERRHHPLRTIPPLRVPRGGLHGAHPRRIRIPRRW